MFFSFPHIGIDAAGSLGNISRPGRPGASSACGALKAALGDIQAQGLAANCKCPGGASYSLLMMHTRDMQQAAAQLQQRNPSGALPASMPQHAAFWLSGCTLRATGLVAWHASPPKGKKTKTKIGTNYINVWCLPVCSDLVTSIGLDPSSSCHPAVHEARDPEYSILKLAAIPERFSNPVSIHRKPLVTIATRSARGAGPGVLHPEAEAGAAHALRGHPGGGRAAHGPGRHDQGGGLRVWHGIQRVVSPTR